MAYTTADAIYGVFGRTNTRKWADTTGDMSEAEIDARITAAIAWADAWIDDTLRCTRYQIPLQAESGGSLAVIGDISAQLAGTWLYMSRGLRDGKLDDRMGQIRADARQTLGLYARGAMRLGAVVISGSTQAPEVVL